MGKHYVDILAPLTLSAAAALLRQKGEHVPDNPTRDNIIEVAKARHKRFFDAPENLWPGAGPENSSIGAERDPPPTMTDDQYQRHLKDVYEKFGLY